METNLPDWAVFGSPVRDTRWGHVTFLPLGLYCCEVCLEKQSGKSLVSLLCYPHGKELSHPNVNIGKRLRNARINKLFLNLLSARTKWGFPFFPSFKHTKSFLFPSKSLSCGPESPEHPFRVWALCFSCLTLWHLPICACFRHFFPSIPPQYPQANTNRCSISTQLPFLNLTLIMES